MIFHERNSKGGKISDIYNMLDKTLDVPPIDELGGWRKLACRLDW